MRDISLQRLTRTPRAIYAVTASIVVKAAERIIDVRFNVTGVVAAGEVFDSQDFLSLLRPDLSIEIQ